MFIQTILNIILDFGVIGDNVPNIKYVSCTVINEHPKLSELAQGKYDAIIEYKNGEYEIKSLKGEEFDRALEKVLKKEQTVNDAFASKQSRGVIGNLAGFLSMLLLLLGSILYKFYYADKGGIARRIVVSKARIC